MTFSITTLSITKLSITIKNVTLSMTIKCNSVAKYYYDSFMPRDTSMIIMLSVIMLDVVTLRVVAPRGVG